MYIIYMSYGITRLYLVVCFDNLEIVTKKRSHNYYRFHYICHIHLASSPAGQTTVCWFVHAWKQICSIYQEIVDLMNYIWTLQMPWEWHWNNVEFLVHFQSLSHKHYHFRICVCFNRVKQSNSVVICIWHISTNELRNWTKLTSDWRAIELTYISVFQLHCHRSQTLPPRHSLYRFAGLFALN